MQTDNKNYKPEISTAGINGYVTNIQLEVKKAFDKAAELGKLDNPDELFKKYVLRTEHFKDYAHFMEITREYCEVKEGDHMLSSLTQTLLEKDEKKVEFQNDEECHLDLLLMMASAQSYLIRAGRVFGNSEWIITLEKFFYEIPDSVLSRCGYSKNLNSFNKVNQLITHTLATEKETYKLAMKTEIKDLPTTVGLEFLRIKQ